MRIIERSSKYSRRKVEGDEWLVKPCLKGLHKGGGRRYPDKARRYPDKARRYPDETRRYPDEEKRLHIFWRLLRKPGFFLKKCSLLTQKINTREGIALPRRA